MSAVPDHALAEALALATDLFDRLAAATADPPGITRASYGEGEAAAQAILADAARALDLEVATDAIGTLRMTLPGRDRGLPAVAMGSHLDSVPHGGNFDGAAGVVIGLAIAAALRAAGRRPARDLLVLGIRAEEMCWFPAHYLGSRALFGLLPRAAPDTLRRVDTGRTLADHMADHGLDPTPIREGRALLDPARLHAFIEPHIEQGPVLVEDGLPVAIVTGIRGSLRYPLARATGAHAHAGAVPRRHRRDAAMAGVALVAALDARWATLEAQGADLVCTAGILATDPDHHTSTKIPGLLRFSLDIRSLDAALLADLDAWLHAEAARIGAARGVGFDFGPPTHAAPASMDPTLRALLARQAVAAGVPVRQMASGAGHDCATFAGLGVPSAMLFLRNPHGSHNPQEALAMADVGAGLAVLVPAVAELLG
ncbi:hydantoinase/carbamoylase family amidase [Roseomonas fluvialis]|uniref:Zn-dependent hydrolase n=1 Tax=Roseomonas fluvialis TaxID=1750527 RepID=A0ABM7YAD9_9PROT|nr:hydantoinase/carbamoylase family amidase [Roseomonas fluvialis]BDG75041.1 Zn-dependent hydrolase [Roseomonas fluvialis]